MQETEKFFVLFPITAHYNDQKQTNKKKKQWVHSLTQDADKYFQDPAVWQLVGNERQRITTQQHKNEIHSVPSQRFSPLGGLLMNYLGILINTYQLFWNKHSSCHGIKEYITV